jgi:glycine/D-amino acid oxidase-like deaminating enzyme
MSRPVTPQPSQRSWWLDEALRNEGNLPPTPALAGQRTVDVAIVGGGYTGLWTALALTSRRPDLAVAVIDAEICGAGASGKNGGKCHGYWASIGSVAAFLGDDAALAIARAGSSAQDGIRSFAAACGRDLWWREGGNVVVSAAPAQDRKLPVAVAEARRLGVPDSAIALSAEEVQARCTSPAFRAGVLYPEAATVHPARLARALREMILRRGVMLFEQTPMTRVDAGSPNRVCTPRGELLAREVVLATNADLAARPDVASHVSVFSSYALITEPAPERLAAMGWNGEEGFADARMFLHYFRKTPDGRVLMGSGSGPISYGGSAKAVRLTRDRQSVGRAVAGLRRLLPGLNETGIAASWGGAIDVSADRLPMFKTVPGTRIHYGCGYSGHGVNPTYIGGQCLAALVLGETSEWSTLPFCRRTPPRLPAEPLRYLGGTAVRRAVIACEEAEERGEPGPPLARAVARLPQLLGLRIGVR